MLSCGELRHNGPGWGPTPRGPTNRGTLVCTNRRIVVVRPSAIRSSMHVAWMDSVNMASIESRRSVLRTIAAIVFLMYAVSSLAGGIVSGLAAEFATASGVGGSLFRARRVLLSGTLTVKITDTILIPIPAGAIIGEMAMWHRGAERSGR